ncbi:hypothetical protein ACJJIK_00820 [Microbulbifer sp. ZKSA006]|uniref:hypothetical protein n=1 Tax=Microbulbifer sp. ZKSA006 TaxID=3243390 RepID=UPI0040391E83
MSKDQKIRIIKSHLSPLMDKIIIANRSVYGGERYEGASTQASVAHVAAALANNRELRQGGHLTQNAWLEMGRSLYEKRDGAKPNSINVACDTLASYVLFVIDSVIEFHGRFELFKNPGVHHHFVVVDRVNPSHDHDRRTWGEDCFVIDLWHAKMARPETRRSCFATAHHWKHGIFRNPSEHEYSMMTYTPTVEHSWSK